MCITLGSGKGSPEATLANGAMMQEPNSFERVADRNHVLTRQGSAVKELNVRR